MVGEDDLHLQPLGGGAEVLDGHPGRDHRALAGEVGVEARLVVEYPDLDDAVRDLGERRAHAEADDGEKRHDACDGHALRSFATTWVSGD